MMWSDTAWSRDANCQAPEVPVLGVALWIWSYSVRRKPVGQGRTGWETAWSVQVLFSDDAARFARLQELTSRRAVVSARVAQLDDQRAETRERLQVECIHIHACVVP
eukprot:scaffold79756_cov43-Prasinocladus_malaysianus.AAC.3